MEFEILLAYQRGSFKKTMTDISIIKQQIFCFFDVKSDLVGLFSGVAETQNAPWHTGDCLSDETSDQKQVSYLGKMTKDAG